MHADAELNTMRQKLGCDQRVHCRWCLSHSAFRAEHGVPDVCPFGVTDPPPPMVEPRNEGGLVAARLAACRACDDWAETKCRRYTGTACRFKTYLRRPGAVCLAAMGVGGDEGPSWWLS